jgi:hypothetical protein
MAQEIVVSGKAIRRIDGYKPFPFNFCGHFLFYFVTPITSALFFEYGIPDLVRANFEDAPIIWYHFVVYQNAGYQNPYLTLGYLLTALIYAPLAACLAIRNLNWFRMYRFYRSVRAENIPLKEQELVILPIFFCLLFAGFFGPLSFYDSSWRLTVDRHGYLLMYPGWAILLASLSWLVVNTAIGSVVSSIIYRRIVGK